MQPCSKCLNPVDNDAVLLKNGLYMCPTCYQRAYPAQEMKPDRQRFYVSVEGVLAVLLIIGSMYGGHLLYKNHMESVRAEALEKKLADDLAEKHALESRAIAEAAQKKMEHERVVREAERKALQEASRVQDEARTKELELKRQQEAQKDRLAEAKRQAEAQAEIDRQAREEYLAKLKGDAEEARKRALEIAELNKTILPLEKALVEGEASKIEKERKYNTYKAISDAKKSALTDLVNSNSRYFIKVEKNNDLWRYDWITRLSSTRIIGSTSVTVENPNVAIAERANATCREIRDSLDAMANLKTELDTLKQSVSDTKSQLETAKGRLAELKGIEAEVKIAKNPIDVLGLAPVPTAGPARKAGNKTIYKKDGTTVQAQSVMKSGEEVRFRDEAGNWQTMKTSDFDRVETNKEDTNAPGTKPELIVPIPEKKIKA